MHKSAFIIFLFMLLTSCYALLRFVPATLGFTMSNAFYIIMLGNMNSIAGEATSTTNTLTFTSGELGAGLYTGTNYTLCAGFYGGIYCNKSTLTSGLFTFSVNPTAIDFGTIDPTSPVTRTNILNVLSSASGYSVTAIEDHSLTSKLGTIIPDVTCDNGTCSSSIASSWTNSLTYGFGYRCDNILQSDCVNFATDSYKPFPNQQLTQTPQIVMQNTTLSPSDKQSQITYKVNVAGSQIPGTYTNTITYIASPNF